MSNNKRKGAAPTEVSSGSTVSELFVKSLTVEAEWEEKVSFYGNYCIMLENVGKCYVRKYQGSIMLAGPSGGTSTWFYSCNLTKYIRQNQPNAGSEYS